MIIVAIVSLILILVVYGLIKSKNKSEVKEPVTIIDNPDKSWYVDHTICGKLDPIIQRDEKLFDLNDGTVYLVADTKYCKLYVKAIDYYKSYLELYDKLKTEVLN